MEKNNTSKENEIKVKVAKIEEQIENLINQITLGNESVSKYINTKIEQLDSEKMLLEKELLDLVVSKKDTNHLFKIAHLVKKWNTLELNEKKAVAVFFLKEVVVFQNKINLVWNYDL